MMYQWRLFSCNKCTTLVGAVHKGEGCVCLGAGSIWGISVPSVQLCCEPKTVLKDSLFLFLSKIIGKYIM